MIDKALLRVLGTNKKYIYYAVLLMILGLLANLAVTASLCYAIRLLIGGAEDASNISGGQKQRLALAVNIVADKDIYVFDEATSNIDIESEAIIMRNIGTLSKERSVILISHRLANVLGADRIYYMENGEVKETGTHDELISACGGYAKLYATQKKLEEGYAEVSA